MKYMRKQTFLKIFFDKVLDSEKYYTDELREKLLSKMETKSI